MADDRDGHLFEASLMLLAGSAGRHHAGAGRGGDLWSVVDASAETMLWVEFETEPAAVRFADLMLAVPDVRCWMRRRVAGIRRRYETFVVDVDAASPSGMISQLRDEWTRNASLLLGDGAADELTLRTRATAVWRSALLTAAPKVSSAGLRLRERDRASVRLLLRAAHLLGVTCHARNARGFQMIHVEGRGVITLLSTIRSSPVPAGAQHPG